MCKTGKVRFKTKFLAAVRAAELGLYFYSCSSCSFWHLTSRRPRMPNYLRKALKREYEKHIQPNFRCEEVPSITTGT